MEFCTLRKCLIGLVVGWFATTLPCSGAIEIKRPQGTADPTSFTEASKELRRRGIILREYIRREGLNADLGKCYSDFIGQLNNYTDFLSSIRRIEQDVQTQTKTDQAGALYKAGFAGGSTYAAMKSNGSSAGDAAAGGLIAAGLDLMVAEWEKGNGRDTAKKEAVEKVSRQIGDQIATTLANARAVALKLARIRGWRSGEVGFDVSEAEAQTMMKLCEEGDFKPLADFEDQIVRQRPRDPFIRVQRNLFRGCANKSEKGLLLALAKDCVSAATLVPASAVFDEDREDCVSIAALLASSARVAEVKSGVNPLGSTESSRFAVECMDWLVQHGARDIDGAVREMRAWVLLADNQLLAAWEQANEVFNLRKNNADFSYGYVCLLSRVGKHDDALAFLATAFAQGYADITWTKADPDLEALRREKPKEFARLTEVQFHWRIVWGVLNDDIVITNNSKFPITNVVLQPRIEKNGKVWNPTLKTDSIDPGATFKWEDAVSIPGDSYTQAIAELSCDQNK